MGRMRLVLVAMGALGLSAMGSVPASATTTHLSTATIRVVHTPQIVVDDMHLQAGQCHAQVIDSDAGWFLPDPSCTPGAIDPAVTQDNISSTICRSGYTKTVRPAYALTKEAKVKSLADYGLDAAPTIEYDHLIALELGGASTTSNLWPEQNSADATRVNNPKDTIENRLHKAVCAGQVTLADAQRAIATDWTTAESTLGLTSSAATLRSQEPTPAH